MIEFGANAEGAAVLGAMRTLPDVLAYRSRQFYRHLKRREIYADASTRWRNPQAQLLEGDRWAQVRPDVLTALGLPENPDALLAGHTRTLDAAYRQVGGRLAINTEVRIDEDGKTI